MVFDTCVRDLQQLGQILANILDILIEQDWYSDTTTNSTVWNSTLHLTLVHDLVMQVLDPCSFVSENELIHKLYVKSQSIVSQTPNFYYS